jgi:hypothetical protein
VQQSLCQGFGNVTVVNVLLIQGYSLCRTTWKGIYFHGCQLFLQNVKKPRLQHQLDEVQPREEGYFRAIRFSVSAGEDVMRVAISRRVHSWSIVCLFPNEASWMLCRQVLLFLLFRRTPLPALFSALHLVKIPDT